MSHLSAQLLLERFEHRLHEHAAEIEELRDAGVAEHRIHTLYPSADDYTARLSQALSDSKVHAKVRRIFQPSASVLPMDKITYEMKFEMTPEQPHGWGMNHLNIVLIRMSEKLTATLTAQLESQHPKTYAEPNAAHAFASMLYIIPIVLPALKVSPEAKFSQHSLAPSGRLEIDPKDFFWRIDQLLLALG